MRKLIKALLMFFSGSLVLYSSAFLFDYVLYPIVIYRAGLLNGFFIMIFLSFIFTVFFLLIYNYLKKDIFAFEYTKKKLNDFVDQVDGSWLRSTFRSILRNSKVVFFIVLSVYDPFIATVFMRNGSDHYNGMTNRDWRILILSVIIGNVFWAPTVFAGISFTEFLFQLLV